MLLSAHHLRPGSHDCGAASCQLRGLVDQALTGQRRPALVVGEAGLPEPELRDELPRRMLALLPRAHRPAARQVLAGTRQGGLMAREREVAQMIAAGHTNREIAEALVLGERTIETHVSNILGRLELTSRRDVARWVTEHGR